MTDPANDPARAIFHIQPARGWTNDPNGMLFRDGRWHVFFQHNPTAARHTAIHWGHVSSPDLLSWHEHPVAFGPTPDGPDHGGCWSGVCVDLGDRVAAAYTGIVTSAVDSTVCLRYASDAALDEWSPPIVVAAVPKLGVVMSHHGPVREMRDPFLFDWRGRRWALLGAGLADGTPALLLWSCDDLEAWRFERVWLTGADPVLESLAPAEIWECPQLVEVDGSWAVLVSLCQDNQQQGTVAAVGSMTPTTDGRPELSLRGGGRVDEGTALYAPQLALDRDGPWLLGWVKQVGAPFDAPDDAVAGCLTLPRRLRVDGDRLLSAVDPALTVLRGDEVPPALDGEMPASAHLAVGPGGAMLRGSEASIEIPPGAEVWVDGEVVEVYPADAPPQTYRDPGAATWRLDPARAAVVRSVGTASSSNPA